jgi:hypothetical protein
MPVDSSIALQVKPVEIPDQLAQYGRLLQLQGLQGQQKLQSLQLNQAQSADAENTALKGALAGIQPDSSGNYDLKSLAPKLMAVSPTQGAAIVKNFGELNKQQADQRKNQIEGALKQLDFIGQVASGVTDQASYDQAKAYLQQNNIDVSQMPPNYDPNAVKMNQMRALSIKDRLASEHQALTLAETKRNNQFNNQNATQNTNIAQQNANTRATTAADSKAGGFTPEMSDLLGSLASKGVSLPSGMRSRQQQISTLDGLLRKYPDLSSDEIATQIANGQINFGSDKKATTVAAAQEGKVSTAVNELSTFGDQVLAASANVPRTKFVPANQLMQMAESSISDPQLLTLKLKLNALNNAYNVLGARGGTDAASRAHVAQLFSAATSPEGLEALVKGLKEEGAAAHQAAADASHLGGNTNGQPAKATTNGAPPLQNAKGWTLHTDAQGNKAYVSPDNKQFEAVP